MNKKFGYTIINIGRKAFVGTPIQKLKITSVIYEKVFRSMYKTGDVNTEYKGVKLTLPTKDTQIVPSILGGYFESLEIDLFAKAATRSKNVLDVGGNIGIFSIVAAKEVKKGGHIYAFEPIAENIAYFEKNVLDNGVKNIVLVPEAVGQKPGKLDIFVSPENIAIHSASKRHSGGSEKISVPMTSIDTYVSKQKITSIDLLKIDVEGYDGYVLQGALQTIKKHKPTIFIEYDPHSLKDCGFKPDDFAEPLFTNYRYCARLDELKNTVTTITKAGLLALPVYCNENLIFTNDSELLENLVAL